MHIWKLCDINWLIIRKKIVSISTEKLYWFKNSKKQINNVLFNDALNTYIYGYMASDIWLRTILIVRKETRCRHIGYSYRLTARVLLYATDRITHTTAFVTPVVEHWLEREIAQWVHPMKDRSDDPSHHERTLYLWAMSRSKITADKILKHNNSTLDEAVDIRMHCVFLAQCVVPVQ